MTDRDRIGLQVQNMKQVGDRVVTVAGIAGARSADGTFTPAEVTAAFHNMNVPPPGNISASLSALEGKKLIIRFPTGRRALTPLGKATLERLGFSTLPDLTTQPELARAQFAHVDHTAIPAWVAPPRWGPGIARLLARHPFDTNVFAMTRFPSEGELADPVASAIEVARDELKNHGLTLHVASDGLVDDDLLGNVGAYMWACRYGLAFIEDRVERGLNYNTVIEIGGMTMTGRRCAILKDVTAPSLPTDLIGHVYKAVDFEVEQSVRDAVTHWVTDDLALA